MKTYEDLGREREALISGKITDNEQMNDRHDEIIRETFDVARATIESEQGPPPAPFAFFLMGSAGRREQTTSSDQDHGIIFKGEDVQDYFLKLGKEVSEGLDTVGYPLCDGNVMASNSLWCRSVEAFHHQVAGWIEEESWQSLRNFSIIFDGRVLVGEPEFLENVKIEACHLIERNHLYGRLRDNVGYVKKGVGAFGQLLTDHPHSDHLEIKRTVYFPFVNAIRLLAMKEKETSAPTVQRMNGMEGAYPFLNSYRDDFESLLSLRVEKDVITPDRLSKEEKKEWKYLIRRGRKLFREVSRIMEEGNES
ncbi:DUF294 nucleotidyltransferase-like domain-containing protein [Salimicrobium halophilum]|uniref:DUF294 nucleotidyltransferase-like domain-containing protein n=1 Tax=Salimicrobium halophilum TaxID=86666 RepID=UPI001FE01C7F|nr:DUF294 nucleotidyltransferase-like domain-containing protein [Salimicrobium halophilum]